MSPHARLRGRPHLVNEVEQVIDSCDKAPIAHGETRDAVTLAISPILESLKTALFACASNTHPEV